MKNRTLLFLLATILINPHNVVAASKGSLAQCQSVQDQINYYTNLRRAGGSARTMESWKRSRQKQKDRFTKHNCKQWRNKLK
ncbi:hypothetical protein [Candidatus Reidiella endopervernicosa]|uniref:DUF1311 domain-containing protein n=1 Tax=Candidatus Reidiella endopervernicosa TaxID=2738883 RepID=A0A6N0HZK5_9GAMM|nr:hypothetical protein [Candidatus Reidiella endopervernicosa]QKQ27810.1 hypothetical protein HUE57_17120 [Candidatus Reidiella endopervernicosa]